MAMMIWPATSLPCTPKKSKVRSRSWNARIYHNRACESSCFHPHARIHTLRQANNEKAVELPAWACQCRISIFRKHRHFSVVLLYSEAVNSCQCSRSSFIDYLHMNEAFEGDPRWSRALVLKERVDKQDRLDISICLFPWHVLKKHPITRFVFLGRGRGIVAPCVQVCVCVLAGSKRESAGRSADHAWTTTTSTNRMASGCLLVIFWARAPASNVPIGSNTPLLHHLNIVVEGGLHSHWLILCRHDSLVNAAAPVSRCAIYNVGWSSPPTALAWHPTSLLLLFFLSVSVLLSISLPYCGIDIIISSIRTWEPFISLQKHTSMRPLFWHL